LEDNFPAPEFVERNEDAWNMYINGYSLREIGKKYKVTRERIRQILGRMLDTRSPVRYHLFTIDETLDALEITRGRLHTLTKKFEIITRRWA